MLEKQCRTCKRMLSLTSFYKDKANQDLHRNACKTCENVLKKEYRIKNKEAIIKSRREYYSTHKETILAKSDRYYLNNKESVLKTVKQYYLDHKETIKEYKSEYSIKNKETIKIAKKEYYLKNREMIREYDKEYNLKNLDTLSEYRRKYRQENKAKRLAHNSMRRVRKAGNGGSHTADEVKYLKEIQNYQCLMCHKYEPEITLTLDHILPISKGGGDGIGNCQMLCKSCNSSKNAKFIDFRRTKPSKTIPTNRRVTTSERV